MLQGPVVVRRVSADGLVVRGPVVYHGFFLRAAAGGASTVNIHDGTSTSGEILDAPGAAASGVDRARWERGIAVEGGIYVDLGANVDLFGIYYSLPEGRR